MKRLIPLLAALLVPAAAAAQSVAVIHAKAWTMQGAAPVEDATIVVRDGRFVSVQAGGPAPAGLPVIDAEGRLVTPGLVNAATQIGLTEVTSANDTRDAMTRREELGAGFDVSYALNGNSALVALARADGLTRAFAYPSASATPPFAGQGAMLRLRDGVDILDRSQAAVVTMLSGSDWDHEVRSRAAQWQLLRATLDEARDPALAAHRDDPLLSPEDSAALKRVLTRVAPLAIFTHRESDIRQAIRLAQDYHLRVVIIGGAEAWRAADALAAAHIPVVLDPEANLPNTFDQLGARQDNAVILTRAGVTVAFGLAGGVMDMNYNAGLALREGAGLAVANGLTYVEALKAVTVNPLAIWGYGPGAGTMTAGADGDLVIWDGDPLEPSSAPVAVVVAGKPVSLDNRQTALVKRYLDPTP